MNAASSTREMLRISDKQVELEMLQRAKAANERPVSMSPDEWEWYKKTGRTFTKRTNGYSPSQSKATYESTEDKLAKEQRIIFKDKLLSYPIKGDNFINGPVAYWRSFILKWIKENQQGETITVSMKKLLNEMRDFGLTFNQKESNLQYPVKEFLVFYQLALKKDLKKKIDITFLN